MAKKNVVFKSDGSGEVLTDARGEPIARELFANEPLDKSFAEAENADLSKAREMLERKLNSKKQVRR